MQTHCQAVAKVVKNTRLGTLRLLVTFDIASKRVSVLNSAYVSGDLCDSDASDEVKEAAVEAAMQVARTQLSTDNIVLL